MKGMQLYQRRYTILDQISSGGFATIYRAQEAGRREEVALKMGIANQADHGYEKSIKEEARILEKLDHPNVVKLYPIPRDGRADIYYTRAIEVAGRPIFFVMEYLRGRSLEEYLEQTGALTPAEAASIGRDIARALYHIHKRGYAHNDLKLENIMFREPVQAGRPYQPVLIDFGIATRVTLQVHAGSPYIMSPEQLGQAKMMRPPELTQSLDHKKVDVWGLGVILYRMLGGKLPFTGRTRNSLTTRIMESRPTSLQRLSASIPPELDELIIDGCLAKDPRYRLDLVELGKELRRLSGGGSVPAARSADPKKKKAGIFRRWRGN